MGISPSTLYTAYICFRIWGDERGVRVAVVRWRDVVRRVSVAERVVRKVVQRRMVAACSRREMGGNAPLLETVSTDSTRTIRGTAGFLVRRVRFLGLVGGFDGLSCQKLDCSGQEVQRDSMSSLAIFLCTAVAVIRHIYDGHTV